MDGARDTRGERKNAFRILIRWSIRKSPLEEAGVGWTIIYYLVIWILRI
jgi:hypothetical protein